MSFQVELGKIYEKFFMRDLTYIFAGFLILWSLRYSFKDADVFNYLFHFLDIGEMDWFKLIIVFAVSYFVGLIVKESLVNDRMLDMSRINAKKKDKLLVRFLKWVKKGKFRDRFREWIKKKNRLFRFKKWFKEGCERHWFSTFIRYHLEKKYGKKDYERNKFYYFLEKIRKAYKNDAFGRLERFSYFMHIGASVGIASLVSCFILIVALITSLFPDGKMEILWTGCYLESKYGWCNYGILFIIMFIVFLFCRAENRWKIEQYIKIFNKLYKNRGLY